MVACWAHNSKVGGSNPPLARSENDLKLNTADVAQSVERKPFKLVAVGSSPTEGKRGGAVVACLSHNQKVGGSNPPLAKSEMILN